jgi:hypothetical protein
MEEEAAAAVVPALVPARAVRVPAPVADGKTEWPFGVAQRILL